MRRNSCHACFQVVLMRVPLKSSVCFREIGSSCQAWIRRQQTSLSNLNLMKLLREPQQQLPHLTMALNPQAAATMLNQLQSHGLLVGFLSPSHGIHPRQTVIMVQVVCWALLEEHACQARPMGEVTPWQIFSCECWTVGVEGAGGIQKAAPCRIKTSAAGSCEVNVRGVHSVAKNLSIHCLTLTLLCFIQSSSSFY